MLYIIMVLCPHVVYGKIYRSCFMTKKLTIGIAILTVCILFFTIYFLQQSMGIKASDIEIKGQLSRNDGGIFENKKYVIEFTVTKKKSGKAMLYPFAKGLINPTFEDREAEKIGGVGTGGDGYGAVIDRLKKYKILDKAEETEVLGFNCPEEVGTHKFKVYYDKLNSEEIPQQVYITYLNLDEKFGISDYWTKTETIKLN